MLKNIKRIAIIGGPGTGKTSLARQLEKLLVIPLVSLDDIKFKKNWIKRNNKHIDNEIQKIIKKEIWIIEGNHLKNLDLILQRAELVIFLDFPMVLQLSGIFKRFFSNFSYCVKNLGNCKEKITFSFLLKTISFNIKKRPKIISKLMKNHNLKLILIANYEQTQELLELIRLKNKVP